ncbi:hypothetical protein ABZ611_08985 [Streptomyces sp. NPDC007861]|uniref:hypothetical protein n=1 Tax=Streptomyces sp. NPDC007861 TaxID=3154893 RepID=UPI00340D6CC1
MSAHLVAVDALLARPFGQSWEHDVRWRKSGDDFYVLPLHVSRDFRDPGDDPDVMRRTDAELTGELDRLSEALDRRWGAHRPRSMYDVYVAYTNGEPLPPLLRALASSGFFGDLRVWRTGDGRWLVAGVGQEDEEEPMVLFAGLTGSAEGFEAEGRTG